MKIIDLLNKIANGEEVPKKIKWLEQIYEYSDIDKFYYQNGYSMYRDFYTEGNCLNEEVEIIEEEKEIEKLKYFDLCKSNEDGDLELTYTGVADTFDEVYEKINEIIDAVNEIRKEK